MLGNVMRHGHTVLSCSWCHTANTIDSSGKTFCWNCWHRADVARADCDCAGCEDAKDRAAAAGRKRVEVCR